MAPQRTVISPQSDDHNQTLGYKNNKDDPFNLIDRTVEFKVFMAGLQNEVAYVSQTWESSLT